jgi:flavin reductase (DIM6/NTAB) family NADH-FMN oxidoreductase RutF
VAAKVALQPLDAPRLLEPGPLALVTSRLRSADNVMTAAWLMPVSLDPPLVAVAVHPGRLTHEYVSKSEYFALNFPTAELLVAVHQCGLLTGRGSDKFLAAGLTPVDALVLDAPLVGECVAHIECGVIGRASFGDHDVFVGQPLAVTALDEAFQGRWLVEVDAGRVLHHLRADYYASLSRPYQAVTDEDAV